MSEASFLTPQEYREQLEQSYRQNDPAACSRLVAALAPQRYPWLIGDGHYFLPAKVAASAYLVDTSEFGKQLGMALGPPQSEDYWRRLAGFTKYIYHRRDWTMLGRLAYRVDWSLVACASVRDRVRHTKAHGDKEQMTAFTAAGLQFSHQVQAVCDLNKGRLEPKEYLQAALAYFRSLPTGFAVPPDLVGYAMPAKDSAQPAPGPLDWPLLRFFWTSSRWSWHQVPQSLDLLAKLPHPFLVLLLDQLRSGKESPPVRQPDSKEAAQPAEDLEDVFEELAGEHAAELPPLTALPLPEQQAPQGQITGPPPPRRQPGLVRRWWNRAKSWWRSLQGMSEKEDR